MTHRAYCFGALLEEALMVAFPLLRSPGVVQPASSAETAKTEANKIRMTSLPVKGGSVSLQSDPSYAVIAPSTNPRALNTSFLMLNVLHMNSI